MPARSQFLIPPVMLAVSAGAMCNLNAPPSTLDHDSSPSILKLIITRAELEDGMHGGLEPCPTHRKLAVVGAGTQFTNAKATCDQRSLIAMHSAFRRNARW